MLLRSVAPNLPPNYRPQNHGDHSSCGVLQISASFLIQPIVSTGQRNRGNPASVTCLSVSKVRQKKSKLTTSNTPTRYGTVDYEKTSTLYWKDVCRRISMVDSLDRGSASVLDKVESQGERLLKWDLCKIVKELRKFRRYKSAVEVYEWMNCRPDRYIITSSDAAIQLDLIAKVDGVQGAEQYFQKLPDGLKDRRIYCSLLNAFVHAGMREKAESLMKKMRNRGYVVHTLPYNVMMTLYMKLKDHDKIEALVLEMKEKNVTMDVCTYNIWLSSCGYQGSLEKMERVYEELQLNTTIKPRWTTFSTMATMYIKLGDLEKAVGCLKKIESKMTGRDRDPYHYLISLYGSAGKREEVYRIWNTYKASFGKIPNFGFQTVISALIKVHDINGAEKIYNEWLSVKSKYDPRIGNLLLGWYVKEGLSDKVEACFNQMIKAGGEPNPVAWEILSEYHVCNMRIPEAVSCLQNAVSVNDSKRWKPKPANISSILKICEQEDDAASKDAVMKVLRQVDGLNDMNYMSYISSSDDGKTTGNSQVDGDDENDCADAVLNQLQESL